MRVLGRLVTLHQISLYAVIALSFLTVLIGGGVGPLMLVGFPIALITSWLTHRARWPKPSHTKWWNIAVFAAIGLTAFELLTSANANIITVAIRFVLILLIIKLYSRMSARDDLQIYALSFLVFAAATTVNEGVSYGILFGLYVLTGTFSLALFHLRTELATPGVRTQRDGRSPFDRYYIAVLALLSVAIFASSLGIFFTFPRVGLGFFVTQSRDAMTVTGFSDSVELGSHGLLRSNPEVVLRVEFTSDRPPPTQSLRWRTMTFDHYDGRRWTQTIETSESIVTSRRGVYDTSSLYSKALLDRVADYPKMEMQIYLEPIGTNLLPVLWPAQTMTVGLYDLRLPTNPRSGSITADAYNDLRHTMESQIGLTYSLVAPFSPPPDHFRGIEGAPVPDEIAVHYLQLPPMAPRTRALALELTADAQTPYTKAEAILNHFEQNFTYSTDLPQVDPDDPIASFLFDAQYGHCEYFATSAVLLLRAAGIPARLVNGFLGGTWNEVGNYLAVRQGDAHSWVEVFIPTYGWVPIDPTPPTDSAFMNRGALTRWASDTYDAMRMAWMKWVIEYDLEAQIAVFRSIGQAFSSLGGDAGADEDRSQDRSSEGKDYSRQILLVVTLLTLITLAFLHGRRLRNQGSHSRTAIATLFWTAAALAWALVFFDTLVPYSIGAAVLILAALALGHILARDSLQAQTTELARYFARLERLGRRQGILRDKDQGPAHFIERLITKNPDLERDLRMFKDRYLAMRFGAETVSPDELQALRNGLRRVAQGMKRNGK